MVMTGKGCDATGFLFLLYIRSVFGANGFNCVLGMLTGGFVSVFL